MNSKKYSQIQVGGSTQYLSEIMSELPQNCIFSKGQTGAGGTSISLIDSSNTVICVPFVELIRNKVRQVELNDKGMYPYEVFGLYSGVSIASLKEYLRQPGPKKIMVTYDSLPKVLSLINPQDYNLLVDEYHIMVQHYMFRSTAIQSVLSSFRQFKSWTFMTATPVKNEYELIELKDVPVVECVWEKSTEVEFIPTKCKSVLGTVSRIIRDQVQGRGNIPDANLHIFCNSVDLIRKIIRQTGLTEENCRAIYSKHNTTKVGVPNGSTSDSVKKINWYSSTCFEGADIYDENAITLVVSDTQKEYSLLDISTQLPQIAGRVRNTKYAQRVYHYFNTNKYLDNDFVTSQEFKQSLQAELTEIKKSLDFINQSPLKHKLAQGMDYLIRHEDSYYVDENTLNWEIRNFEIVRGVYRTKVNVLKEYQDAGLKARLSQEQTDQWIKTPQNTEDNVSIAECIQRLKQHQVDSLDYELELLGIQELYPWLIDVIQELGIEKIEELNYSKTNLEKACLKSKSMNLLESDEVRIFRMLPQYKTGKFISRDTVKQDLQAVYDELDIKLKAKATSISEYYNTQPMSQRVQGKVMNGFLITGKKINIK